MSNDNKCCRQSTILSLPNSSHFSETISCRQFGYGLRLSCATFRFPRISQMQRTGTALCRLSYLRMKYYSFVDTFAQLLKVELECTRMPFSANFTPTVRSLRLTPCVSTLNRRVEECPFVRTTMRLHGETRMRTNYSAPRLACARLHCKWL